MADDQEIRRNIRANLRYWEARVGPLAEERVRHFSWLLRELGS